MGRFILSLIISCILVIGAQYYYWAEYSKDPYQGIGSGLAIYMPDTVRKWGCECIAARLPDAAPPGCAEFGPKAKSTNL